MKEVPNQLNRKFFTKPIDFEGLLRVEKDEYPVAAVREMLLYALIHRNYMAALDNAVLLKYTTIPNNSGITKTTTVSPNSK